MTPRTGRNWLARWSGVIRRARGVIAVVAAGGVVLSGGLGYWNTYRAVQGLPAAPAGALRARRAGRRCRPSVDRRPAVRQPDRRSGARPSRRRPDREHHRRPVAHRRCLRGRRRHRAGVQGQGLEGAGGRPGTRRSVRAAGQRPAQWQPDPHPGASYRHRDQRAALVGVLRRRQQRPVPAAGSGHDADRQQHGPRTGGAGRPRQRAPPQQPDGDRPAVAGPRAADQAADAGQLAARRGAVPAGGRARSRKRRGDAAAGEEPGPSRQELRSEAGDRGLDEQGRRGGRPEFADARIRMPTQTIRACTKCWGWWPSFAAISTARCARIRAD